MALTLNPGRMSVSVAKLFCRNVVFALFLAGCVTSQPAGLVDDAQRWASGGRTLEPPPRRIERVLLELDNDTRLSSPADCDRSTNWMTWTPVEHRRSVREAYDAAPEFSVQTQRQRDRSHVAREAAGRAWVRGDLDDARLFARWALSAVTGRPDNRGIRLMRMADVALFSAFAGDFDGMSEAERSMDGVLAEGPPGPIFREVFPGAGAWSYWRLYRARGAVALARGDLATATARFRDALAALSGDPHAASDRVAMAVTEAYLAESLWRQGNFTEAEGLLLRALKRPGPGFLGGETYFVRLLIAVRLAELLFEEGRFADAEAMARLAIRGYATKCRVSGSLTNALAHDVLARALLAQRKSAEAIGTYDLVTQNLEADRVVLESRFGASVPWGLAEVLAGRIELGEVRLRRALAATRVLLGENHYDVAEIRGFLGMARLAAHDLDGARPLLRDAVVRLRAEISAGREPDLGSARAWRRRLIVDAYLSVLTRSRAGGAGSGDAESETFEVMQLGMLNSTMRAIAESAARAVTGNLEMANLVRREQDLRRQVATLEQASLAASADPRERTESIRLFRELVDRLRSAHARARDEVERRFPDYARLLAFRPTTLALAQAALRPHEALVVIYPTGERTYVWAVTRHGPPVFAGVPISESELFERVDTLRRALAPRATILAEVPPFDVSLAWRLYDRLLAPVAAGWRDARALVVLTAGPLTQLPLGLLVSSAPTVSQDVDGLFSRYRAAAWLARSHAVSVVPSVDALVTLRNLPTARPGRRAFLGVGDPWFSPAQEVAARRGDQVTRGLPADLGANETSTIALRRTPEDARSDSLRLSQLAPLPETADEIRALARALGADRTGDVLLGEAASEARIKAMELRDRRVLAFATHGVGPGDIDGLTQPALALTPPEVVGGQDDGLLTASEILDLKLDADWVILSACNTATEAAGDGMASLARAFFYAGARALLVSHWPVHSEATRVLVTDLFERYALDPLTPRAEALRRTMLDLIDRRKFLDRRGQPVFSYAHPIFWAPFSVVGDGD